MRIIAAAVVSSGATEKGLGKTLINVVVVLCSRPGKFIAMWPTRGRSYCFCRKIFRCLCDSSPAAVETGRRSACGFFVRPIFFFFPFSYNNIMYIIFFHGRKSDSVLCWFFSSSFSLGPAAHVYTLQHTMYTRNYYYYYYYHYFDSFPTENHRTGTIHFTRRRVHNIPSSSSSSLAAITMTMMIITVVVYRAAERCPRTDDFRMMMMMMYRYYTKRKQKRIPTQ